MMQKGNVSKATMELDADKERFIPGAIVDANLLIKAKARSSCWEGKSVEKSKKEQRNGRSRQKPH
jgi:hypothetical protein